ncbi:MAG: prepilin peptidase [Pirellulaceae bacterium]|nr:prepilin peptidase [Pirellulaceae bacterium]
MPRGLFLPLVARCLDATLAVWFFSVGASIGSFLNVVAYRLPLGKTLGGHSACPFCATPIASTDNVPVLAWLRLRGRCRTCRLPISIQYPLVELAVGLVFLAIYFLEFGIAGSNLPGSAAAPVGIGLIWMSVTQVLAVRVLMYLFLLSGLIAAALMIVRASRPPLSLFGWVAAVLIAGQLIWTDAVIVPWWGLKTVGLKAVAVTQPLTHLDVVLTLLSGLTGGLVVSLLTFPFLHRLTNRIPWMGVTACAGLLLGWQALPLLVSLILVVTWLGRFSLCAIFGQLVDERALGDPVTWSWLGLVLFRATWKASDTLQRSIELTPSWSVTLLPLAVAILLAWLNAVTCRIRD